MMADAIDTSCMHVRTTDMHVLEKLNIHTHTISMLKKGPNFRPNFSHTHAEHHIEKQYSCMEEAIHNLLACTSLPLTEKIEKMKTAQKMLTLQKRMCKRHIRNSSHEYTDEKTLVDDIEKITRHFTLTVVDKAANNYALICTTYVSQCIHQRLHATHEIQPLPTLMQNPQTILQHLQHMIIDTLDNRHHVIHHTDTTAISGYMLTPKIIKLLKSSTTTEEKRSIKMWRCITTAHNAPSAILGSVLNKIANTVKVPFMDHYEMKSKKYFQTTGIEIRFYYRTDAAQAVICDWHDKCIYNMVKGDYSRMFETIPHSGVIEAVLWKFDLALKQTNSKYLCIDSHTGTHRWTRRRSSYGPTSKLYCIDRNTYENFITTHLNTAVMMYDNVIYKQYHGVPQGAKSSKTDSEDYIDHKLYKFTKMLMQTHRHDDIKQLRYLYFVADDLCAANCPSMPLLLHELSPTDAHGNHYLELKIENECPLLSRNTRAWM